MYIKLLQKVFLPCRDNLWFITALMLLRQLNLKQTWSKAGTHWIGKWRRGQRTAMGRKKGGVPSLQTPPMPAHQPVEGKFAMKLIGHGRAFYPEKLKKNIFDRQIFSCSGLVYICCSWACTSIAGCPPISSVFVFLPQDTQLVQKDNRKEKPESGWKI